MYDLMQLNIATMGSREIAKLTDKDHKHVVRDVEMLNEVYGYMSLPKVGQCDYKADNGQIYKEYILNQEQCIDLITGYSREIRIKVNRRWQDLEKGITKPAFQIPQTLGEALQLAANQALQIEQDAPKVNAYDKLINSKNLKSVGDVAKSIGLRSAQALNKKLETVNAYDGRCANRVWSGWFIEQGLGEMKTTDDGYSSNKMTAKGQAWALDLFGGAK